MIFFWGLSSVRNFAPRPLERIHIRLDLLTQEAERLFKYGGRRQLEIENKAL